MNIGLSPNAAAYARFEFFTIARINHFAFIRTSALLAGSGLHEGHRELTLAGGPISLNVSYLAPLHTHTAEKRLSAAAQCWPSASARSRQISALQFGEFAPRRSSHPPAIGHSGSVDCSLCERSGRLARADEWPVSLDADVGARQGSCRLSHAAFC